MRLGIVSDTHMPYKGNGLPKALVDGMQGVDLILHAGDFTAPAVVDLLEEIAPVEAVTGNNDGEVIYRRFGRKKLLILAGFRVALIHGDGFHKTTEERAREAFRDDRPDLIIFGHSHIPLHRMEQGVMMFNPGSPTDKRRQPRFSFGLIELGKTISAEHVFFDEKT